MENEINKLKKKTAETELQNQKIKIMIENICRLKKQMNETDYKRSELENELKETKLECVILESEFNLSKNKLELLKSKVEKQMKLFKDESSQLENIQQDACKTIDEFMDDASKLTSCTKEITRVENLIKIRRLKKSETEEDKRNLVLEGEVRALNLYKKLQEQQLKRIEDMLEYVQNGTK